MELLQLDIVTPDGAIFSGKVKSVFLPGEGGEFGVLPGHSDVLTLLVAGVIEFETENACKELVAINSGYAKVNNRSVDILADGAVAIGGDESSQTAVALEKAKTLLEEAKSDRIIAAAVMSRIESTIKNR